MIFKKLLGVFVALNLMLSPALGQPTHVQPQPTQVEVLVGLRTGAVYDLPDDGWKQQGTVVSFSKIPVYDSPVAIAEASLMQIKN